jgi:hypothetical protein
VVGQEFMLFSWKLVLCDAFIMLYVLIITTYLLLLGSNLTTNVVISAILTYVPLWVESDLEIFFN